MMKSIDIEELQYQLATGQISIAEFWRPQLLELANAGKWKEFVEFALARYETLPDAFMFYDKLPDNLKYYFCTEAYTHHGDSLPIVRKAVRSALKYGKPKLPKKLATADEITVYRAGEEPINLARYRISWTTDKKVALFFLNEYNGRHASHLYRGKIKPEKIICYTNDRKEKEIMQYNNVYDLEEITDKGGEYDNQ